jgi:hypothetical protein
MYELKDNCRSMGIHEVTTKTTIHSLELKEISSPAITTMALISILYASECITYSILIWLLQHMNMNTNTDMGGEGANSSRPKHSDIYWVHCAAMCHLGSSRASTLPATRTLKTENLVTLIGYTLMKSQSSYLCWAQPGICTMLSWASDRRVSQAPSTFHPHPWCSPDPQRNPSPLFSFLEKRFPFPGQLLLLELTWLLVLLISD